MKFEELSLPGVFLVSLERHHDDRGYFSELVSTDLRHALGFETFPQLNFSSSGACVFRGMHLQLAPSGQGKLIFCIGGSLKDYVLDVSPGSSTFGQNVAVNLSENLAQALFIPSHYAHGFLAGDNGAQVLYAVTKGRVVDHEISINFESTSVAKKISGVNPIISDRDKSAMSLDDFVVKYPTHQNHS